MSKDYKVCVYGSPKERIIAYVPSLGEEESEGFMGHKKIGINFSDKRSQNQSAYKFKDRGKYAIVSHRHFVKKKGDVFFNYVFDDVVECLRDENQPELAVAVVRLGVDFYFISESDFYSTREEIESRYRPYKHIEPFIFYSTREEIESRYRPYKHIEPFMEERVIGFAVIGTSARLKAFIPFDWSFFKKNRKESPSYIYDDITDVSPYGKTDGCSKKL